MANRQCSIGYHEECASPFACDCECHSILELLYETLHKEHSRAEYHDPDECQTCFVLDKYVKIYSYI